jgi:hypothetical protein
MGGIQFGGPSVGMRASEPLVAYQGRWIPSSEAQRLREAEDARQQNIRTERARQTAIQAADTTASIGGTYRTTPNGTGVETAYSGSQPESVGAATRVTAKPGAAGGAGAVPVVDTEMPPVSLDSLIARSNQMVPDVTPITAAPPPAPMQAATFKAPTRLSAADTTGADNARFSAAKSKVGIMGRASINALRGLMAERGLQGSGIEGAKTGEIVAQGFGELGDVENTRLVENLRRQQAVDDTNFAAEMTAAGANQGAENAAGAQNLSAGLTSRGQDIGLGGTNAGIAAATNARRLSAIQSLAALRNAGVVY